MLSLCLLHSLLLRAFYFWKARAQNFQAVPPATSLTGNLLLLRHAELPTKTCEEIMEGRLWRGLKVIFKIGPKSQIVSRPGGWNQEARLESLCRYMHSPPRLWKTSKQNPLPNHQPPSVLQDPGTKDKGKEKQKRNGRKITILKVERRLRVIVL